MLPLIVVAQLEVDVSAVEFDTVVEALVVTGRVISSVREAGSLKGEDGGDAFISSNSGDLLVALIFGAPFKAELLANCR